MAIMLGFQPKDTGSIPVARSKLATGGWKSPRARCSL